MLRFQALWQGFDLDVQSSGFTVFVGEELNWNTMVGSFPRS